MTMKAYSHGRSYENGWCGPEGIVAALRAIAESSSPRTETFLVMDHHTKGDRLYGMETIGVGEIAGEKKWRWGGENGDPMGAGSHTICEYEDIALAAATIALRLESLRSRQPGAYIYRERVES